MLIKKKRSSVPVGEWFYHGRKEFFSIQSAGFIHVSRAGILGSLDGDTEVQQHDEIFMVPDITLNVNTDTLIAALRLSREKQREYGHPDNRVVLCVHADGVVELEGDENESYFSTKFEVLTR